MQAGEVILTEIDIDKSYTELPPNGKPAPDRGLELYFARSRKPVGRTAVKQTLVAPERPQSLFDKRLAALINKKRYSIALDCLRIELIAVSGRAYAEQIRLYVLKSLLEAVTGNGGEALISVHHAEQMFWANATRQQELWPESSVRLYFSINLAKKISPGWPRCETKQSGLRLSG